MKFTSGFIEPNQSGSPVSKQELNKKYFEWAMGLHRKVLKITGLWLYPKSAKWYIKILMDLHSLIFAASVITFFLTPQFFALIIVWGDLTLVVDNLLAFVPTFCGQIKLLILWTKRKAISRIMNVIESDWLDLKDDFERTIMVHYARIAKIMMVCGLANIAYSIIIYHGSVVFGFLFRTITNLTDIPTHLMPLQSVYPFDITIGHRCLLIRILQVILCFMTGLYYTEIDVFFGISILHSCGQLKILAEEINCLANSWESVTIRKLLKAVVLRHYRIISLVEEIKDMFGSLLLFLVMCFGITLSSIGYMFVNSLGSTGTKVPILQMNFYAMYIFYFIGLMFVYSWVGENLITQSQLLYLAAYNCNWTTLDPKDSKQLIILVARSQQPLYVTIGKFAPVSLNTFAKLLKSCMGYISFLMAKKTE